MTTLPKQTLCVNAEQFLDSQRHDKGWLPNLEYTIEDMVKPNSLQILPYVVLVDKKSGRVLTYRRSHSTGQTNRAKGVYSIGFGCTIDEAQPTLMQAVLVSATKELESRVGVDLGGMLKHVLVETETSTLRYPPYKLLHAQQLMADRHPVQDRDIARIGVMCVLETNVADYSIFEQHAGEHAEWRSMPWLSSLAEDDSSSAVLESWSQYIINSGLIRALRNQNNLQKLAKAA